MLRTYRTLYREGIDEIIIERSKFIGYSKPVDTEEEAIDFIEKIKKKHRDATHNVPAYVIGYNNGIQRYSDDGEPSGTAGIPVLEVIKKEDLRNVVVVVTRYFGGTKLGAGGLVRAYTRGAKIALDAGKIVIKRPYKLYSIKIEYPLLGKIQNELIQNNYLLKKIDYDEAVHLYVYIKFDEEKVFLGKIMEWTNGNFHAEEIKENHLVEYDGRAILP